MFVTWKDSEVARARRKQFEREAAVERSLHLAHRARASRPAGSRWLAVSALRLARWMIVVGCRLETRYANAVEIRLAGPRSDLNTQVISPPPMTSGC
jgi:hypothetical protein